MNALLAFSRFVERIVEQVGRLTWWMTLAMVLLGAFNAVARYQARFTGINLSSNGLIEAQWYLFSAVFLLGAAYAFKHDAHVRVDVLYSRLSFRAKAWLNLSGNLAFLIPFCCFMLYFTWPAVVSSWNLNEMSPDPGGLPRYPVKSLLPIAFSLLLLQAFADTIKQVAVLKHLIEPPIEEPREAV